MCNALFEDVMKNKFVTEYSSLSRLNYKLINIFESVLGNAKHFLLPK